MALTTTPEGIPVPEEDVVVAEPSGSKAPLRMTKAELIDELADRDAQIAQLKQEIANPPFNGREEQLLDLIADKDDEIEDLKTGNAALRQNIIDLVAENQELKKKPVDRQPPDGRRMDRETSVFSQATSVTMGHKRSGRVPDPPIFYNEEDRDTIEFEQWHRAVVSKLRVNADHYHDDQARQIYVESRLGGRALQELSPYLRSTYPEPITSSERLLAHLWEQYYDPMKAQKALDAYDELRMKPGDDYLTFKNDFVRLAGECGKPRTSWKHEFNRRLTDTLQRALAGAFIDDTVVFDHFVRLGMQHAMINKRISDRQTASRQTAGRQATVSQTPTRGSRGGRAARGSRTNAQTATGPDPAANPRKEAHTRGCPSPLSTGSLLRLPGTWPYLPRLPQGVPATANGRRQPRGPLACFGRAMGYPTRGPEPWSKQPGPLRGRDLPGEDRLPPRDSIDSGIEEQ